MKKIITVALLLLAGIAGAQETKPISFTINGKIDDVMEPAKVVLQYAKAGKRATDTVPLTAGRFSIKGTVDKPERSLLYVIKSSDNPRMMIAQGYGGEIIGHDGITLYLDEGTISITGTSIHMAKVKGSQAHADYEALHKELQPFYDKQKAIGKKMGTLTPEQRKGQEYSDLMGQLTAISKDMIPLQNAFINSHLDSYVSWDMVVGKSIISDPAGQKELLHKFSDKFLNSKEGKEALARVEVVSKTAIGQPAPLFTQNDTTGKPVALSSLKGKYVLVDFWASWCGPCRKENPNVKQAYEKFKNKNFEILAVSLDNKKDAWLKAIKDDGLPWIHVSDLKGWNNAVGALYNVRAVPQNFLIDPNGVIVATNLRGSELGAKLEEILK